MNQYLVEEIILHLLYLINYSLHLNPENSIQNINLTQLKQIFKGDIHNWKQVGGNNDPILILIRSSNSGTYIYFKDHILEAEPYCQFAQAMPTTFAVVNSVAENSRQSGMEVPLMEQI